MANSDMSKLKSLLENLIHDVENNYNELDEFINGLYSIKKTYLPGTPIKYKDKTIIYVDREVNRLFTSFLESCYKIYRVTEKFIKNNSLEESLSFNEIVSKTMEVASSKAALKLRKISAHHDVISFGTSFSIILTPGSQDEAEPQIGINKEFIESPKIIEQLNQISLEYLKDNLKGYNIPIKKIYVPYFYSIREYTQLLIAAIRANWNN